MFKGKVKWFDSEKGFGFIAGEDGKDLFVHYTGIMVTGYRKLEDGQTVEYEIEENERGPVAVNVMPVFQA